jgi:hypothetical protein
VLQMMDLPLAIRSVLTQSSASPRPNKASPRSTAVRALGSFSDDASTKMGNSARENFEEIVDFVHFSVEKKKYTRFILLLLISLMVSRCSVVIGQN